MGGWVVRIGWVGCENGWVGCEGGWVGCEDWVGGL